ncbi:MAG: hypothetical protein AB1714_17110 [Acidobacteriota bacterium]
MLRTAGGIEEIPDDYVFVFACGELPYDLLRRAGIELRSCAVP